MPRNPNKKPCQLPGCNNWAMKGHFHCRSHLDPKLGPRGARLGSSDARAPKPNLNVAQSGQYANPFTTNEIREYAYDIIHDPGNFPNIIDQVAQTIHQRTGDNIKSTMIIKRFFDQMLPYVADHLFNNMLHDYLQTIPPAHRPDIQRRLWNILLPLDPMVRLKTMMIIRRRYTHR